MIFLTIGTHEPFDRLVKAVDDWAGTRDAPVFGQITDPGPGGYTPKNFPWVGKMSPEAYEAKVAGASFLVAQAGMGSIITALTYGKPIVILPRRGALKETRNDHQFATAQRLGGKAGLFVALDEQALPAVLDDVLARAASVETAALAPHADAGLIAAVRGLIFARSGPAG